MSDNKIFFQTLLQSAENEKNKKFFETLLQRAEHKRKINKKLIIDLVLRQLPIGYILMNFTFFLMIVGTNRLKRIIGDLEFKPSVNKFSLYYKPVELLKLCKNISKSYNSISDFTRCGVNDISLFREIHINCYLKTELPFVIDPKKYKHGGSFKLDGIDDYLKIGDECFILTNVSVIMEKMNKIFRYDYYVFCQIKDFESFCPKSKFNPFRNKSKPMVYLDKNFYRFLEFFKYY